MILIDANILIYAAVEDMPNHDLAKDWLEEKFNIHHKVAMPWISLIAFLRITTNARVFQKPLTIEQATSQISDWLEQEQVWIPQETTNHFKIITQLLNELGVAGNLVTDIHLAALSIEHGLTLCSFDRDFAKFKSVKWINPLDEGVIKNK